MNETLFLIWPWVKGINNTWNRGKRQDRLKSLFFALLGIGFWAGLFVGSYLVFGRLAQEEPFGSILVDKLLSFAFVMFFAVLVFSSVVTSLNTFFLSDDLYMIFSAPLSFDRIYLAKYVQTLLLSSWMVLLFATPVFIAHGIIAEAPWFYYPWMIVVMLAFMVLPCAIATMITMILVKAFPARKMQDILIILAIIFVVMLYFLFRFLQPEQLFNPDIFHGFTEYFATLQAPDSPLLPTTWAYGALKAGMSSKAMSESGTFYFMMMLANGFMAMLIGSTVAGKIYFDAYSKSQEGRKARITTAPFVGKLFNKLFTRTERIRREFMLKDTKTFFRETTQWTQLLLLMALIVVYLYNYKVLNLDKYAGITVVLRNSISYLNMLIAGFVISAICVRFVLPAVSIEGRAFWIIRTAPVKMKKFLWTKFLFNLVPIFIVSEVLIIVSNIFLKTTTFLMVFSAVIMGLVTICIVAMAIGIGAMYPNFEEKNVARMSSGASSIIFMVIAVGFMVLILGLMAVPAKIWQVHLLNHTAPNGLEWAITIIAVGLVCVLSVAAIYISIKKGVYSLETME